MIRLFRHMLAFHSSPFSRVVLFMFLSFSWCWMTGPAEAFSWAGRKAVLFELGEAKLAKNEPYVWGKSDCSSSAWDLMRGVFPEFKAYKWFRRTTAEAMATWPWDAVMSHNDLSFGDLLFTQDLTKSTQNHRIHHVMIHWEGDSFVHASVSKGFTRSFWTPWWRTKLELGVRPPY
jgi:cell wall-associated NlpC family hydrolase